MSRYPSETPDIVHGLVRLEKADSPFRIDFEQELRRLENVSQLGLVTEVYRPARYAKLEYLFGAYHLLNAHGTAIPSVKGRESRATLSMLRKAILAHGFGRLPFTFAAEAGLSEACEHSESTLKWVSRLIVEVRAFLGCEPCKAADITHVCSHEPKTLNNWIAAWKVLRRRRSLDDWSARWSLDPDALRDLISALACRHNPNYSLLKQIDKIDYVTRDFHHSVLGTLEINFQAALAGLGGAGTTPESRFVSVTEEFLKERLYLDKDVALLERLISKQIALLIVRGSLRPSRLVSMDDHTLAAKMNRHGQRDLPTFDELVQQVMTHRWQAVGQALPIDAGAALLIEDALGDRLTYPFARGIVLLRGESTKADPNRTSTTFYARTDDPAAIPALALVLQTLVDAPHPPLKQEGVQASVRPLALAAVSYVLASARLDIRSDRIEPLLQTAVQQALTALAISPNDVIQEIVTAHTERFGIEDLGVTIAGVPIFNIEHAAVRSMSLRSLAPHEPSQARSLVNAMIHEPACLPTPLMHQVAEELRIVRDDAASDQDARAIAAELREYVLANIDVAPTTWVFPPASLIALDGSVAAELDQVILTLLPDNKLSLEIVEITISESEEKAATDLAKAAKVVSKHRRGAMVVLRRMAPRDAARYTKLN